MEIKQLKYFVAVSEKGSLNKAAECLYTSQPNVSKVISGLEKELGIVYIARNQLTAFQHILTHKNLRFSPLDTKELCIYAGRNNPLYDRDSVRFFELPDLKFISGVRDYFSMEHHLETVSLGIIKREMLNNVISTTSEYVFMNALMNTDICAMGVNFLTDQYRQYGIKALTIEGCEPFLAVGWVIRDNHDLSRPCVEFIEKLKQVSQGILGCRIIWCCSWDLPSRQ